MGIAAFNPSYAYFPHQFESHPDRGGSFVLSRRGFRVFVAQIVGYQSKLLKSGF